MWGTNCGRVVRFTLDGQDFERRLVHQVRKLDELNVESPVGGALATARPGDELTVRAPGGDVVVKVLEVV
jgi:transcription elongation GreA/GreB family factor